MDAPALLARAPIPDVRSRATDRRRATDQPVRDGAPSVAVVAS